MRKKASQQVALAVIVALGSGCGGGKSEEGRGGKSKSRVERTAKTEVSDAELAAVNAAGASKGTSTLRRLTPQEIVRTVAAVFRVDVGDVVNTFPPESGGGGYFRNHVDNFRVSPDHVQWMQTLGSAVASRVKLEELAASSLDACAGKGKDEACLAAFVGAVGLAAWRRPPTAAEIKDYLALVAGEGAAELDLPAKQRLLVEALVQDPVFLYHLEGNVPGLVTAADFGIASRMAYFLWNSAPDAELLDAAGAGRLHTAEQIKAAAERMLADGRARDGYLRFIFEWTRLNSVAGLKRNEAAFPEFTGELRDDMLAETAALFGDLFDRRKSVFTAFDANYTFASDRLAAFYGLKAPANASGSRALAPTEQRGGFLTHGSILFMTSEEGRTSVMKRGQYVLSLLCAEAGPPPKSAAEKQAAADQSAERPTKRSSSDFRQSDAVCKGCHNRMDPLGFAFEGYSQIGKVRATDELGDPVETGGTITLSGQKQDFDDAVSLGKFLAADAGLQRCFTRRALEYATGRDVDGATLDPIFAAFKAGGFDFRKLAVEIATHGLTTNE